MPEQPHQAPADPHDPMAPRADDPRIGRWWWAARLYRRQEGRPRFFGGAGRVVLMVLAVCGVAVAVVWALGRL